jgi:sphinganine-1-phosphate aldolase
MKMPKNGMKRDEVFEGLEALSKADAPWRDGRMWGYVFDAGAEVEAVAKEAYTRYLSKNALDFTVFPSVRRLENEIVALCAEHLRGGGEVVGNFTSGGTESCLLAVKAARDYFRAKRPEILEPEIVLPVTAHAAFHKAAHYFGLKAVVVPVNPRTGRVEPEAMRRAVTPSTILLVGSASCYSMGTVDPIRELGQIALDHGLLLHVDGCIGGFLLPYFRRLGDEVPDFDFTVPGVTSISMDLHKYAYCAKGASVVLYRDAELRKHQIFATSRWYGYTMVNTTVQSTKSAGPMAAAWAVMHFIGDEGYLKIAQGLLDARRRLQQGIESIPGLRVLGPGEMSLIAFTSDAVNVFEIVDDMVARGWYLQPHLRVGDLPQAVHLSINPSNVRWVDALLADLADAVEKARQVEFVDPTPMVRAMLETVDPAQLGGEGLAEMMAAAGIEGTDLPERRAGLNAILNALPPEVSEPVLIQFTNDLFRPQG